MCSFKVFEKKWHQKLNYELKLIQKELDLLKKRKNIKKGEKFDENNIFPIRPNTGFFKPSDLKNLIGRRSKKNIKLLDNKKLKKQSH